jgi:N-acetylmuramoyl-L-alanine amidase
MIFRAFKSVLSVLLLISVFLISVNQDGNNAVNCVGDAALNGYVFVLDAGHGGEDGGAIGITTLTREKEINLSITLKLKRLLESVGAIVVLTRSDGEALCKGGFNKMEDMTNRARIIENTKPYMVISVHCNSFPADKSAKGAQVFYYPDSEQGKILAECIKSSITEYVDSLNQRTVKEADFYMLRHGSSVNVMVECGFLSCPEEEKLLLEEKHQDKIAYAIFDGTVKYILKAQTPDNI